MNDFIDAGIKLIVDSAKDDPEKYDSKAHFIYCGNCISFNVSFPQLKKIILKTMEKYRIQSLFLTTLTMSKRNLITKERAKKASEGKLKNEPLWEDYEGSINDDLESFCNKLMNKEEIEEEVKSFFTPKLTTEVSKLINEQNREYMRTISKEYVCGIFAADDDQKFESHFEEMKKSESKDIYVHTRCHRETIRLTQSMLHDAISDKTKESSEDSEDSSEDIFRNSRHCLIKSKLKENKTA